MKIGSALEHYRIIKNVHRGSVDSEIFVLVFRSVVVTEDGRWNARIATKSSKAARQETHDCGICNKTRRREQCLEV
jgi:hypothetical protein